MQRREKAAHPGSHSQRYLSEVHYGNITAGRTFPCFNGNDATKAGWLFVLVFDYGERTLKPAEKPLFKAGSGWLCRQDPFSGYAYGFDLRTRRLCRQVLMFHRLETLAEKQKVRMYRHWFPACCLSIRKPTLSPH